MFSIQIRFLGGLNSAQQAVFDLAAARWSEVIIGDVPRIRVDNEIVDDIIIEAQGTRIDGPGRIFGQAGSTILRPITFLPAKGMMEFDDVWMQNAKNRANNLTRKCACYFLRFKQLFVT